jgi:hypothetical protein
VNAKQVEESAVPIDEQENHVWEAKFKLASSGENVGVLVFTMGWRDPASTPTYAMR